MSGKEQDRLVQALDERGVSCNRDNLARAFEAPESRKAAAEWVQQHVNADTLLTREERIFHESRPARSSNLSSGPGARYIADEDIETAFSALEASTAAIEKQCRLLEKQKRTIGAIIARGTPKAEPNDPRTTRFAQATREKAQLDLGQIEIATSLHNQLHVSTKQSDDLVASIPASIERIIEKDDKLLDGLEGILAQLTETEDAADGIEEANQLCEILAAQLSEDARLQIDAAYQTAVQKHEAAGDSRNGKDSDDEIKIQQGALQAELSELCLEIGGLSTIAVDNQYRGPILQALRTAKVDKENTTVAWADYVEAVLRYIIDRLAAFNDHVQHAHVHRNALHSIKAACESVAAPGRESKPNYDRSPAKLSQKGLKPLRLVQANLSENQDPVVQILRMLEVRDSDTTNSTRLAESMVTASAEQRKKIYSLAGRSERAVADMVAQSLAKSEVDARTLLQAVYSPSEFGHLDVMDSSIRRNIDRLESGTQEIGHAMRELNADQVSVALEESQRALLKDRPQ